MAASKLKIELLCISLILIKVKFSYLVWGPVSIRMAFLESMRFF